MADMTTSLAISDAPEQTVDRESWWALAVLLVGSVMIVLDFFIVNVALPSIESGLNASGSDLEWVVAGYGLTFAALLVTAGRLGDRFGRRRVFITGLVGFGAASALCGLAPDISVLITARCVQGCMAALISPTVLSLIRVMFPGPERARAISWLGMAMGLATAGGELVGGVLLALDPAGLGWRTLFLINVPVAAIGVLAARRLVPESRAAHAPGLDPAGVGLVTAGLVALVLPLVQGRALGWPTWTWVCLGVSALLFGWFVVNQRRAEQMGGTPILPPSLFQARQLRAGLMTQLAFWGGQAALFMVLSLYLQDAHGLHPLGVGLMVTILAVAYMATSLRAPAFTARFGRDLIAVGALVLAAGDGALAIAVASGGARASLFALVPGLVAAGAGMGLCLTPLTAVVLAHADPERAGAVAGALSTMQQVGNALGVAVTGVIFFAHTTGGPGRLARGFALSAAELAGLLIVVAALTRLLPSRNAAV